MEEKNKVDELLKNLKNLQPLEEVPADVSKRFHETLSHLASSTSDTQPKKSWLTGTNQFALAASFTLVFALGAVFTLDSGSEPGGPISIGQNQGANTPTESNIQEDQLLYSAGEGSIPKTSSEPIKIASSAHDYSTLPTGFSEDLGVGFTWNSSSSLKASTAKCLRSLELDESTNLIDSGFLNKTSVMAIWTPVSADSWNIYLVDGDCEVLQKSFSKE